MRARNVLVVVGGTASWIQHLFANRLLADASKEINSEKVEYSPIVEQALGNNDTYSTLPLGSTRIPSDDYSLQLHTLPSSIDPDTVSRWHRRDTRRILRNLSSVRRPVSDQARLYVVKINAQTKQGSDY